MPEAGHSKSTKKNQASERSAGELFLVATPIGNLGDITLRALEVLKSVDRIACEDTRTSGVLLKHYGIQTPLLAYHAHNETRASQALVEKLLAGEHIALISDAGTPLLSDPGGTLVSAAAAAGIRITPLPGASALLAALSIAGLPALPFYFAGFLPPKSTARRAALAALKPIRATLALYESPNRLVESLNDAADILGDRPAAVARELTKLHEECQRACLRVLATHYAQHPPRGECVVMIEGASDEKISETEDVDRLLRQLLATHSVKEVATIAAAKTGLAKRALYARALELK